MKFKNSILVVSAACVVVFGSHRVEAQGTERFGDGSQPVFTSPALYGGAGTSDYMLKLRIKRVEAYVKTFEREVEQEHGNDKGRYWRSREDAMQKVMELRKANPGNPQVELLFSRVRAALKKSMGDIRDVKEDWTAYKKNEAKLREFVWKQSEARWNELIAQAGTNYIEKAFPIPDIDTVGVDDLKGKLVVLDASYPDCQFYGVTGEYLYCGKPSTGFWYVKMGGRNWVGCYEAVKRYRELVDSDVREQTTYQLLGEVTSITAEYPDANKQKLGSIQFGFVVTPVAIMSRGHVVAFYDAQAESGGHFVAEEKVPELKDGWYTYKKVPADVTPVKLMEIFMYAIKEKNYDLYVDCIDPRRHDGGKGQTHQVELNQKSNLRYFWQLHQERFRDEYVHAVFEVKGKVDVLKGFDRDNAGFNYFLDDDDMKKFDKANGDRIERICVMSKAFDEHGKQRGNPTPHNLVRFNGGRWYVEDFAPRF